jgi:hypothetical protein
MHEVSSNLKEMIPLVGFFDQFNSLINIFFELGAPKACVPQLLH